MEAPCLGNDRFGLIYRAEPLTPRLRIFFAQVPRRTPVPSCACLMSGAGSLPTSCFHCTAPVVGQANQVLPCIPTKHFLFCQKMFFPDCTCTETLCCLQPSGSTGSRCMCSGKNSFIIDKGSIARKGAKRKISPSGALALSSLEIRRAASSTVLCYPLWATRARAQRSRLWRSSCHGVNADVRFSAFLPCSISSFPG
jgi:hypothetical protein